jgi:hypothetical protein
VDENITISYKSPPIGTCQTAYATQEQYTGWVNIPGIYSTNTFFWFIAARTPTTQLTIWLNGGPGSSSMIGLFTENGPCEIVELADGKFGTTASDWGWDRASNMLYIDQVRMLHNLFVCFFSKPLKHDESFILSPQIFNCHLSNLIEHSGNIVAISKTY